MNDTPAALMATLPSVLLVVSSLAGGGAERAITGLANAWAEKGWRIGLMTISDSAEDHYPLHPDVTRIPLALSFPSHTLWQGLAANLRRSSVIRHAVHSFEPDCVVSFVDQTNVLILTSLVGSRIPTIVAERTDPRHHDIGAAWSAARRLLYRTAARVVVQTDTVADWARGFMPRDKVTVIPNFVAIATGDTTQAQRPENEILAVGRLAREKGFDLLLRAFALSGLASQGVSLTILGEGPERAPLSRLADELGIGSAVTMPGLVSSPERWMNRCTLFVLSSRFEGFPNALLEAMALGCAVVATDCPSGPGVLVQDGVNGLLVPPDDIDALARAIASLVAQPERRARLGQRAQEVRQRYGQAAIIGQWENMIMKTIGENR